MLFTDINCIFVGGGGGAGQTQRCDDNGRGHAEPQTLTMTYGLTHTGKTGCDDDPFSHQSIIEDRRSSLRLQLAGAAVVQLLDFSSFLLAPPIS